jgi:aldose 1-epimerase
MSEACHGGSDQRQWTAMDQEALTIESDGVRVDVDPVRGGRIAQVAFDGMPVLIPRGDEAAGPLTWGAYPMVPWAGRIRHGRFEFRGETYSLPTNHGDHAMHGVGFTSVWSVTGRSPVSVDLHLALPEGGRWPFGGSVDQRFDVSASGVRCSMSVTAAERAFPVSFGWHPWFRKPDRLEFRPEAMYRRDRDHIAVDDLIDVPAGPWDDCFVNRLPIGLTFDGIDLVMTSDCDHWVVYDEPLHATCVEPQTGPPDAFTIRPRVVEPGESVTAWFRLDRASPDHRHDAMM